MPAPRLWRGVAIAMCALVPVGFYAVGDATDAFPGILTIDSSEPEDSARPRAQGEDYERPEVTPLAPAEDASLSPEEIADLKSRMDSHLDDAVIDGNLAYSVVDAQTQKVIVERDAETARTPASTLKLLTATAALRTVGADTTLPTSTVLSGKTLTLVGGGDMRLTTKSLGSLADQAVASAKEEGTTTVTLALDDTLFGPGINPAWGSNGPSGGWVAPTSALAIEEGWLDDNEYGKKSSDPAMDAAKTFRDQLIKRGLKVKNSTIPRREAPAKGLRDQIHSAPLSDLVAHTLLISDNTTAEVLGRLVAIKQGKPATAAGAAQAVQEQTEQLAEEKGLSTKGLKLVSTCGLAKADRVPPELLAGIVATLDSSSTPAALRAMLTEVPIGGLTGTLADRFTEEAAAGRGVIRGKTGYLGGTSTLVGVTVLSDGRPVGFSIVVHGFPSSQGDEAKAALDRVAAEMVTAP